MTSQLHLLLDSLYDSLLNEASLDEFMALMRSALGSNCNYNETFKVTSFGVTPQPCIIDYAAPSIAEHIHLYHENGVEANPYFPLLAGRVQTGDVVHANDVISRDYIITTEHYERWLKPIDAANISGILLEVNTGSLSLASFHHSEVELRPEQRQWLHTIAPHMTRFFKIKSLLHEAVSQRQIQQELLNQYNHGVLLLNAQGVIVTSNRKAEQIFSEADGLSSRHARVKIADNLAEQQLANLLGSLILSGGRSGAHVSEITLVPRPSNLRPYQLMVAPIRVSEDLISANTPIMTIFITDPETELNLSVEQLQQIFDLSPTEARLALQIASGVSLEQAAEKLGHKVSTSRNLLKRVFQKTGTNKQNELAAEIMRRGLPVL